jgi:hypothetical protein
MNVIQLLHLAEQIEAEGCQACRSLDYQAELRAAAQLLRLAARRRHASGGADPTDTYPPPAENMPGGDESYP